MTEGEGEEEEAVEGGGVGDITSFTSLLQRRDDSQKKKEKE